ncbi:MAG: radical SAM protein [Acidobacteria bacterium]|nr:radical SAM protein [Acidobacteriota bacterium]
MRAVHPLAALARTLIAAPALVRVRPSVSAFLAAYLQNFQAVDVDGHLVLHSHLPPLDSPAYARFVRLHLVNRVEAPSHAQVAVTNACPQRCAVCYNRDRTGAPLDRAELYRAIDELISCGVVWLGITGGEPLLRRDLPDLVAIGRNRCAMKLFTTGMGVTPRVATELRDAGLFSVSVSIDHWDEATHDEGRGFPGAWRAAVGAIETFLVSGGLHVGISAVLSREQISRADEIDRLMGFAGTLGVHEVWLSESKPAVASLWRHECVITEDERRGVAAYQNRWNSRVRAAKRGVTLNYLGHFEGAEQFGCNAGRKMVYVDPFGDVSPCVFTSFSLGNLRDRPLLEIIDDMRLRFQTGDRCLVNRNWPLVAEVSGGVLPMGRSQSLALLDRVEFGSLSEFNRKYYRRGS